MRGQPLIGREREQAELTRFLTAARDGQGRVVLLAGEAGMGKTRLAEEALAHSELLILRGSASQGWSAPYGPIIAALRSYLRITPGGLPDCGPLAAHLALLLPELGAPPDHSDRTTLFEAICDAFSALAQHQPMALFLDDLHWADSTTLELLPALASRIESEPLMVIAAYRSDELPRGHPLRRMRTDLRRAGRLFEIGVEPLTREATTTLVAHVLGAAPSPSLAATLYDRTQGVPFFIEELAAALAGSGRLQRSNTGVVLAVDQDVPVPDTVRDAVLLRTEGLSEEAQQVLEVAAVAGQLFDLDLVAELTGQDEGLEEPIERGLINEVAPGRAAFRHALTREALYGELAWPRRRALHRQIAEWLEARRRPPGEVVEHWLVAREFTDARRALLVSAEASCQLHAYRDAARAARQALELWPEGEDEPGRLAVLARLGECAQLCGELLEAVRAWREVAVAFRQFGDWGALAQGERQLATVYEIQGASERALAARQAAAEAFAASGLPGEAAAEQLAVAEHLESAGRFTAALEVVTVAAQAAAAAGRVDLQARAQGLEGEVRVDLGQSEAGLEALRAGLALALEQNLSAAAGEIYYRLAVALYQISDYAAARDVYLTAITFCQTHDLSEVEQICTACLAVVLRQTGEWDRAIRLCREVLALAEASPPARAVAAGLLGSIKTLRGERGQARRLLLEANTQARQYSLAALEIDTTWGLALVDELEGADEAAAEHGRLLLACWEQTEDRHYVIPPLRWATTFFATRSAGADARACAQALASVASGTTNPEALAGLAHALGECALLEGDALQATLHFNQSLELLSRLEVPFARAQTQVRAAVALAATGEREAAVERLSKAYRIARKLGARPLVTRTVQEMAALGESVERRLGRRAAAHLQHAGLSRRELEVLRLVSKGWTSREIAHELFLSPRTVEMYVGNILTKLNCRSRAEATHKAHELHLL
ncbi:MAG: AAA family ATPase [Chloroflexota bacterium]|nr:AAA family ATPase [Chloroflexota bacterium]